MTAIGKHNKSYNIQGNTYRNMSTVCIVPAIGPIPVKVVQSWMGLMAPMNQKFTRIFVENMEVGDAYNAGIEMILANPELSKWKYVLTLETDNVPPPDGLIRLLDDIGSYDAIGGLYWTKGEGGKPMCYGNPNDMPLNFVPWLPPDGTVTRCNGLGMGFTLFKMHCFKRTEKPWFKTIQEYTPGVGGRAYTQDLQWFEKGAKAGLRFAISTNVKVGHYDSATDQTW